MHYGRQAYFWTKIRKNRTKYMPVRGIVDNQVASIILHDIVVAKDLQKAENALLNIPGMKKYLDGLSTGREKEWFRRHLRKYMAIYLPDCPFEVTTTNRYTITTCEAAVCARKFINAGETIKGLSGTLVGMTKDEEDILDSSRKDFSIVMSSRKKAPSLFLGPARFANHDCNANAKLVMRSSETMEIVATRDIDIDDEITVTYGEDYFGEDNCECLCHTCELNLRNGWARPEDDQSDQNEEKDLESSEMPREIEYTMTLRKRKRDFTEASTSSSIRGPRQKTGRRSSNLRLAVSAPSTPDKKSPCLAKVNKSLSRHAKQMREGDHDEIPNSQSSVEIVYSEAYGNPSNCNYIRSNTIEYQEKPEDEFEDTEFDEVVPVQDPNQSSEDSEISDPSNSYNISSTATSPWQVEQSKLEDTNKSSFNKAYNHESPISTPPIAIIFDDITPPVRLNRKRSQEPSQFLESSKPCRGRPRKRCSATPPSSQSEQDAYTASPTIFRTPNDYILTPRLLTHRLDRWVNCTTCSSWFLQINTSGTLKECPRCTRHSMLYGYQWPKTDREGRKDTEQRVMDHRTIYRFLTPAEEAQLKRSDRLGCSFRGTRTENSPVADGARSPSSWSRVGSLDSKSEVGRRIDGDEGRRQLRRASKRQEAVCRTAA